MVFGNTSSSQEPPCSRVTLPGMDRRHERRCRTCRSGERSPETDGPAVQPLRLVGKFPVNEPVVQMLSRTPKVKVGPTEVVLKIRKSIAVRMIIVWCPQLRFSSTRAGEFSADSSQADSSVEAGNAERRIANGPRARHQII